MRRLTRLVCEMRILNSKYTDMLLVLRLDVFDDIIEATKRFSKYDRQLQDLEPAQQLYNLGPISNKKK